MMRWRKSSRSGSEGGNCVELGHTGGNQPAAVRDSKNPTGPVLRLDLAAFVDAVKGGRYDG